jgi:hypothetical protein
MNSEKFMQKKSHRDDKIIVKSEKLIQKNPKGMTGL